MESKQLSNLSVANVINITRVLYKKILTDEIELPKILEFIITSIENNRSMLKCRKCSGYRIVDNPNFLFIEFRMVMTSYDLLKGLEYIEEICNLINIVTSEFDRLITSRLSQEEQPVMNIIFNNPFLRKVMYDELRSSIRLHPDLHNRNLVLMLLKKE